jgi:glycosyltransferase involved in cell wall biosynthesis
MLRERIRVLYYTDPTAFQIFGGAEIQMLKTKEYLEKMNDNVFVKFFDVFNDKLDEYDILHIFQMRSDCLSLCKLAKIKGLKIVLSSIYWPETETWRYTSMIERMLSKVRIFYSNFKDYNYPTFKTLYPYKDFLEAADVVVPTSRIEAGVLSKEFRINPSRFFPVPVGVEKTFSNARADFFVQKYGLKDFVLFLGRIEQTKNVLTLLKAYRDIEVPLVIIGHFNLWEHEYFVKCKELIERNRNIHFLGFMTPHSKELLSAYAAAKVFVLPSWHEVTSLTALEAGLAGCNIVLTNRSYMSDYFKDLALYVNPASAEDIEEKILEAYQKPKTDELKQHILNNYTWEQTAKRTMEAYDVVLCSDGTVRKIYS